MADTLGPMTAGELDELDRLAGAATSGPWQQGGNWEVGDSWDVGYNTVISKQRVVAERSLTGRNGAFDDQTRADMKYIAASRTAVPRLVAEVRRLTEELTRLQTGDPLHNTMNAVDELRVLRNHLSHMSKRYREHTINWALVRKLIMPGTDRTDCNSCMEECRRIGIDPEGYTLEQVKMEGEDGKVD